MSCLQMEPICRRLAGYWTMFASTLNSSRDDEEKMLHFTAKIY